MFHLSFVKTTSWLQQFPMLPPPPSRFITIIHMDSEEVVLPFAITLIGFCGYGY